MSVFRKHYTRDEARKLLPEIREWLNDLVKLRDRIQSLDGEIGRSLGVGDDLGGEPVNSYVRSLSQYNQILLRFRNREIQIKDLDRGLIDFPAYVSGQEVFLCWEKGEDDIEFWHHFNTGYAGREPLD